MPSVAIILDCGSGLIKSGFSGEDAPRSVFSTVVGRPRASDTFRMDQSREITKDRFVGCAAQDRRGLLTLSRPIQAGKVTNWEDLEAFWSFIFREELKVDAEEHPILLTEPPLGCVSDRERAAQIIFERYNAPALYVGNQAALALYSSGKTAGVVVDSGEGLTHVVAMYQGSILGTKRCKVAGQQLTEYLTKLLNEGARCYGNQGAAFSTSVEWEIVQDIKERLCYVAYDFTAEQSSTKEKQYVLPDGQCVSISLERIRSTEVLFHPSPLGLEPAEGLHRIFWDVVGSCAIDLRRELCANVLFAGGTTKLPGLDFRLVKEVKSLVPGRGMLVKISAPPDRLFSAWIGGSILASLSSSNQKLWVTKQDYEERGSAVLRQMAV